MAGINDIINQANADAANLAGEIGGTTGYEGQQGGALIEATASASGQVQTYMPMSMDDVLATTKMIPPTTPYLKVKDTGLLVGSSKIPFRKAFKAQIEMVDGVGYKLKSTMRYSQNPAKYVSTYDGLTADKGGSWNDAMRTAKAISPDLDPYPSADVLMTVLEDVKDGDGTVVLKKGEKLAFAPSKTNWQEWVSFYGEVKKAGKVGQTVEADVFYRAVEHNNNSWGVVTFTLKG